MSATSHKLHPNTRPRARHYRIETLRPLVQKYQQTQPPLSEPPPPEDEPAPAEPAISDCESKPCETPCLPPC